jgi:aspartyl-tRNA synthetase
MAEGLMAAMFRETLGIELRTPFPRFAYQDAMNRFGTDKPDLRIPFEMRDLTDAVTGSSFKVFASTVSGGGSVKVLAVPEADRWSRKKIDEMEELARTMGAKGLAWAKVQASNSGDLSGSAFLDGGIARFLDSDEQERIIAAAKAKSGEILLMVASDERTALETLGAIRLHVGVELGYIEKPVDPYERDSVTGSGDNGRGPAHSAHKSYKDREFAFCWIVDFPLFARSEETGGWEAEHHMFSMPREEDIELLETDPGSVKGQLYDVVCNGVELASGSIRIHRRDVQEKVMRVVGLTQEQAEERFGFLLKAFEYGAPPHGGIAPGLDRIVMIIAGEDSIREVIAFPKTARGISLMDGSPSPADDEELRELHLRWEGLDKD